IAVVGLAGSGRTRTAASLASAYAAAGRTVTALSLEPARGALELARLTDGLGVELEIADAPELVARAKRKAEKSDVVVVDTPPLPAPRSPSSPTAAAHGCARPSPTSWHGWCSGERRRDRVAHLASRPRARRPGDSQGEGARRPRRLRHLDGCRSRPRRAAHRN